MKPVIKLDTKVLDKIIAQQVDEAGRIVRGAAFAVEGQAKVRAPVDLGALKGSIYTVTAGHDGYPDAKAAVKSANPDVLTEPHPRPKNKLTAHTGPCVEYAAPIEFGHLTRPFKESVGVQNFVAAQPYLIPAVEAVRPAWDRKWREFFARWK
jgi:hypothetical protein